MTQALKVTLFYHRHNLTEELLAEIFNTSRPTISRTINTVEKALQKLFSRLIPPLDQLTKHPGYLVIDGTLIPTWNWRS
ncbi:transposase family protein [Rothia terrae]|uniref:transposase family protein n=1 Tax=Rothia terrae TaxID=396015 RepID=UPI0035CD0005